MRHITVCAFTGARRNGFTLIEVLIAVALLSVIIAVLYSTFFLSQKAVAVVDNTLVRLQETRGIIDTIRRELESSYFSKDESYSVFKVEDRDYYGRQSSQIIFTAFSPLTAGLAKISYITEENHGNLVLKKRIESAFGREESVSDVILIEDIESFTVELKLKNQWVRTWDSEQTGNSPEEIRITLAVKEGEDGRDVSVADIALPRIGRTI